MKSCIRALGLAAALLPVSSFAGVYLGASGLKADRSDYSDVESSYGGKAYLGYRFEPVPIILEASYIDTGDAKLDRLPGATSNIKMNFSGYTLGAGYFMQFTGHGSGMWLRGAWYSGDTRYKVPAGSLPDDPSAYGSLKQSSDGGSLAVGGMWKVNDWFGLRLEYETLFGPKDFVENGDIGIFSTGVVFEFGNARAAAPQRSASVDYGYVAEPSPAPQTAPESAPSPGASESASPAVEPAAAPSATQEAKAPRATTGAAQVVPLASITVQLYPRRDAGVVFTMPAGASYERLQTIHGEKGDWIFVQYEGRRGWLFEGAR